MLIAIIILSIMSVCSIICSYMLFRRLKNFENYSEVHFSDQEDYLKLNSDMHIAQDNLKIINDALDLHIAVDHYIKPMELYDRKYSEISTYSWAVVCTKDEKGKQTCNFYQLPDEYVYIKKLMDFLKEMRFKIVDSHPQFSQYFYDNY